MPVVQKAITLKLFPTNQQIELLLKSFGSSRFVYNHFLGISNEGKYPGYSALSKELTKLKSELSFLKEVDKFALQNSLRDLDDAFKRFFKRQNRYPKFKNKHKSKKSYRTNMTNGNIKLLKGALQIPKVGRLKTNKKVDSSCIVKIVSVTIKQVGSSYYAKVQVDWDNSNLDIPEPKRDVIGIDLGLTDFIVASNGERIPNPKYFKVYSDKLANMQRRAARCKRGSNNQKKLHKQIARLNQKIADSRNHFHHHLSKQIVDENQVIVIETLKVKNMLQDKDYARYIADSGWGQFVNFLSYKSDWKRRTLIKADPYFASTQICSECRYKNPALKAPKIRKWICPKCGAHHDRDLNASYNLENYGREVLSAV